MKQRSFSRTTIAVALTFAFSAAAWCGPAAGELFLDRSAVRDLIVLALPEPATVDLAGFGTASVRVDAPTEVAFRDGGVEASLPLHLSGVDGATRLRVRLVPGIEPVSGTVRLEPESVVPELPLPFDLDLASWFGSVDLPRRLDWDLALEGGRHARITCFVQGLAVLEERVRLELGLITNP